MHRCERAMGMSMHLPAGTLRKIRKFGRRAESLSPPDLISAPLMSPP